MAICSRVLIRLLTLSFKDSKPVYVPKNLLNNLFDFHYAQLEGHTAKLHSVFKIVKALSSTIGK